MDASKWSIYQCSNCGKKFERLICVMKGKKYAYCNVRCKQNHDKIVMLAVNNPRIRKRAKIQKKTMIGEGNPNYGNKMSKKMRERMSNAIKEQYENGRISWCKGLTKKNDKRLKRRSDVVRELHIQKKCGMYGKKHTKETRKKQRLAKIRYVKSQCRNGLPISPTIGKNETKILDEIERVKKIKLTRQYLCIGYYLDGYDEKNNIAYEIDEEYHLKQKEKDMRRKKEIIDALGCKFWVINDFYADI